MESNYFALLELPVAFDLDKEHLRKLYTQLQQRFHPDRVATLSTEDRQKNLQLSMDINQAYHTLKDPLLRAQHLLALEGIQVNGENDTIKPPPALLMEMMEFREAIQEGSVVHLQALQDALAKQWNDGLDSLSNAFRTKHMARAAEETIRLRYIEKIRQELRIKLQHGKESLV